MKRDLQQFVDDLFKSAYEEEACDEEYQATFTKEGLRKAQYIVDDLRNRESAAQLQTCTLGYLCIGGADGSEVKHVMTATEIAKAVMIEFSDAAVNLAATTVAELSRQKKLLTVLHGDATTRLDDGLSILEHWCEAG